MRTVGCALALSLIFLNPANADPPLRSTAAQVIADASAADVFEVVPDTEHTAVRHTRSGLVCRLDPGNSNRIVFYPDAARGEDVGCESRSGAGETIKFIATRYTVEATLDAQVLITEDLIRRQFPDAQALPAATQTIGGVRTRTVQFMITRAGVPVYTRASMAVVGQWSYALRYTAGATDAAATARAERVSAALWNAMLNDLTARRS